LTAAPAQQPLARWARLAAGPGALLVVIAAALAFQLPIYDRWFSFMDEGHMLLYADLITQGGELYGDATVYPLPGAFYLLALIFEIFEPSNLVARWVVVVEFTVFAALIFLLLRRALPLHYALAGFLLLLVYRVWAFPHWHMYNYSTTALLIQMAALFVLLTSLERESRGGVAWAGLLFGFGVLVKQDYGAVALLALVSLLVLHATTRARAGAPTVPVLLGCFLAPASAVGAATGLYFWHHDLLGDLLRFTVFNHFAGMSEYPYSTFPSFFPLFEQDAQLRGAAASAFIPGILLTSDWRNFAASDLYRQTAIVDTALKFYYYLPYFVVAASALRLWWCRGELRDPLRRQRYLVEYAFWAFAAGFVLLVSLNRPQDYVHLAVLYFPLLLLGLFPIHALLRSRRVIAWLLALLFVVPASAAGSYTADLWWRIRTHHTAPIDSPRAGILVTEDQAALFNELLAYIRENSAPEEPIAVMPYFPLLTFYAERKGPHRSSYIVWPYPEIPDRDRRVIEAMEQTQTQLVIYNFTQFTVFNLVAEYAPELYEYLVGKWEIERIFTTRGWGYKLAALRRREEPTQGRLWSEVGGPGGTSSIAPPGDLSVWPDEGPPRPIEPSQRAKWAQLSPWPFRPALALQPTRQGRTTLRVPVEVPPGAQLRTAVAVHPKRWYHGDPAWAEFQLSVVEGEQGQTLFQRRLRPASEPRDRGWIEVELPLDAWAGQSVVLEFSTSTNKHSGESLLEAGWALPRIVSEDGPPEHDE